MPINPPNMLNNEDSVRNCIRISIRRAPIALRKPISRVRSVTETSMIFIIPMPPTSKGDGRNAAQEDGQHAGDGAGGIQEILLGQDREIIGADGAAVAGAQDLGDLIARLRHLIGADRLHEQHIDTIAGRAAQQARLGGGQGHQDLIIRVAKAGAAF